MSKPAGPRERKKFEGDLRDAIAGALCSIKSYNLPEACTALGLATGTPDEASSSKGKYVANRLQTLNESALIALAQRVLEEHDHAPLRDLLSEKMLPVDQRISGLTRREIINTLDSLDELYGDLGRHGLRERLDNLAPSWGHPGPSGYLLQSLLSDFERHYLHNDDWHNSQLLEYCGALSCAQERFVAFLDSLLHPEVRRGEEQTRLAGKLGALLAPDGYCIERTGDVSGHPIFAVVRKRLGVAGSAKNLIFASTGAKPDIVLRDAINNDLEITRNADLCLVYERPLSAASGLTWLELAEWWRARERLLDIAAARKSLGKRLMLSRATHSPGELAQFRVYFDEFAERMGRTLPALLPQVYLHYDPLTARERNGDPVLVRQRMDFLLLLPSRVRIVLEVDGQHHYAQEGRADPARYAAMAAEDRQLRLKGYEIYRFGGAEFADTDLATGSVGNASRAVAGAFFEAMFARHGLL